MVKNRSKITLSLHPVSGKYTIEQIKGSTPTVDFPGGTARVGYVLDEAKVAALGDKADLTINKFK